MFSFLGEGGLFWRISSRIVLLPVVAGIAYEIIKYVARKQDTFWGKIVIAPGLWLQKLTTREPDDQQLEVAICALQRVLEIEERVAREQQPISRPMANPA